MLAYLAYLQIFANMFTSVIQYFFPGILTYREIALITSLITAFVVIKYVSDRKCRLNIFLLSYFCIVVLLLYLLTANFYYVDNSEEYKSFLLVLAGQIFPAILTASIVAKNEVVQLKIKKLVPLVATMFTTIAFSAAFFSDSSTSGGFVKTEYGLNYQTTSYLAAYATGFCIYFLLNFRKIDWYFPFRKKSMPIIFFILLIVNFISILVSGGRGGLILFIVLILFYLYFVVKQYKFSFKSVIFINVVILLVVFFVYKSIEIVSNLSLSTNGFKRIIASVEAGDSSGRDIIYLQALDIVKDSPILGHGLGSVFLELGFYSHNFFIDALVETGIIGCILFSVLLVVMWNRGLKLLRIDSTNSLWLIIFLDGFVMSLFSGYYIGHIPLYWSMFFIFCFKYSYK